MSMPVSSAARSTPSLTVAPTQNTAPVVKFRCLYSHDLRRKAKRWHDGFLRFHTFNKRVMVYDTPGNFIGDLHWRESEEIQDGDEMELDKGVLIQVGEYMEKTQTDLSGLFEKKTSQGSPPQNNSTPQFSRVSMPRSSGMAQAPLKSLNELLGIGKTPIGRAITPKSPYEQRHPQPLQVGNGPLERPAKRQKPLPPENILHKKNPNQQIRGRPTVIDLEEPTPRVTPIKSIPGSIGQSEKEEIGAKLLSKDLPAPATAPERPPNKYSEPLKAPSAKAASFTSRSSPKELAADTPINALRISSSKPRRKLMYRALLEAAPKRPDKAPAAESRTQSRQAPPVRSHGDDIGISTSVSTPAEFIPSDSTLFVLDEMIDAQPSTGVSSSGPTRQMKPSSSHQEATSLYSIPSHSMTRSAASNFQAIRPFTSALNQSSLRQQHDAVPDPAAEGREHSTREEEPSRPPAPVQDNVLATRHPVTKSPKTFRKSLSDPTALRSSDGNRSILRQGNGQLKSTDEDKHDEKGPWTSEALDLFDWWPPGRPKPS